MKTKLAVFFLIITFLLGLVSCISGDPGTTDPGTDPGTNNGTATVASLTVSGAKASFAFGEDFSAEGLTVTAKMSDGSEKALDSAEYTLSSEDYKPMKSGTYQISVKLNESDISATYDVTVNPANKLKVLMIGNSYADDTINYAYEIAKSSGIPAENILVADIYIGSCSLETHWNNAQSNAAAYRFGLEKEGWFDGTSYNNWTMKQAIEYADWDFITLQQNSGNSGLPASYSCLQNLMDYVLGIATDTENNPNANPNVKLVWHQTWAYAQGSTNAGFSSYNNDQMTMYDAIMSCVETHVLTKDFVAIIPNGTAIQNARTSLIGDALTRDNYDHLSYSEGRYIAAMGLVGTLTGRDMTKVNWKPTDSGFDYVISDEKIVACKESFTNAARNPYEVTVSEHPVSSIFNVFEGKGTESEPYLIQSANDMWKLSELTEGQTLGSRYVYFKLTADINLSGKNWVPICSSKATGWVEPYEANSFNGNFDGNGKTITFAGAYTGDTWSKGLFSAIGGYVHDLTLRGTLTTEKGVIGALAGYASTNARIENITSYVNITAGNTCVGGIIGRCGGSNVKITNCVNYGTITGRDLVGGIMGGNWTNITYTNCANHGAVTATSIHAGGIAPEKRASSTLTNCSNDGTVKAGSVTATTDVGTAESYAGYLIGKEYN